MYLIIVLKKKYDNVNNIYYYCTYQVVGSSVFLIEAKEQKKYEER